MKKFKFGIVSVLLLLLVGCFTANLQSQWNKASEDERARIVLNQMQTSVDTLLDTGAAYIAVHPEKKADWQQRVLPMFKSVNDMIGENIKLAKANQGKVTVAQIMAAIQPKIAEIEAVALSWGFSKK